MTPIVLASSSAARAAVLSGAGVLFDVDPPDVDESTLKTKLLGQGVSPSGIAKHLAGAKALDRQADVGTLVIGADQTLEADGELLDKTSSLDETRQRLIRLRGRTFELHSAVAGAMDGEIRWRRRESARLTMRLFSDDYLEAYLSRNAADLSASLAGFALEGEGAQLFERIDGDYFAILGLPLLPLLAWLRSMGALPR